MLEIRTTVLKSLQNSCTTLFPQFVGEPQGIPCNPVLSQLGAIHLTVMKLNSGQDTELSNCTRSLESVWESFSELNSALYERTKEGTGCRVHGISYSGSKTCDTAERVEASIARGIAVNRQVLRGLCSQCEAFGASLYDRSCQHYSVE
jgi:hypothetical protein